MTRFLTMALVMAAISLPGISAAQSVFKPLLPAEGGCVAEGQLEQPGVARNECTYTAQSDSQDVTAVTLNTWFIWVMRDCPSYPIGCKPTLLEDQCTPAPENDCEPFRNNQGEVILNPKQITLLEGPGLPEDEISYTVHPEPGEVVTVTIRFRSDIPPGSAAWGFVQVQDPDAE